MEHLSTSFLRSSFSGSFKEHRMVFVNVPTEIRTSADVQQAVDAHTEALDNSNDAQREAARRVLTVQRALAPVALHGEIDAAIARMDRNTRARESVPVETTRLEAARRTLVADKLNSTAAGDRNAGINNAVAQINEARVKLAELGDNARLDSQTPSRVTLSNLYREHVNALTDMTKDGPTLNKLKINATQTVDITPALSAAEKLRITSSFGNETGQTDPSKVTLGRGYLAAEGATEAVAGSNEFRLNTLPVDTTIKLDAGKWKITRSAIGADPSNAAVAALTEPVVAHRYNTGVAPLLGNAADIAKADVHNRIIDNLIALNAGNATTAVDATRLTDMITRANTKEVTDSSAALAALNKGQSDFYSTDFNAAVIRLNGAATPEAKREALDSTVAPVGMRVLVKNRRDVLWTNLKTISEASPRPSNYNEQAAKIMDFISGPAPDGLGARLREQEVRAGVATPDRPAATPDATLERPATTLNVAVDGRNIIMNVAPPTAQVSVRKPDGTVERKEAVAGVIRIEGATPGRYDMVSGTNRVSVTVSGTPDATLERPATSMTLVQNGRDVRINVAPANAQVSVRKPDGTVELKTAEAGVINMTSLTPGRYEFTSGTQRTEITVTGTPDASVERPATSLTVVQTGRNVRINVAPPTAQVSVRKPDGTVELKTAVAGVISMENLPGGRYEFTSGGQRAEVTVEGPAAAPTDAPSLGTEAQKKELRSVLEANRANLRAEAVTKALAPFQTALAGVPEGQRVAAVQRLSNELAVRGIELALNGANIEARAATTPPTGPVAPERRERMSEFIKVLIELIRALLQIEQARSASIDRFLTRSLEQQQKFMADMQAQMKAMAARGGTNSPEYRALQARYKTAQEQIRSLESRVKELEGRYEAAVKAARGTRTLEVRWSDEDRRVSRPPVVCVRAGVRATAADVSADIAVVRREVPLVPTTVVGSPAISGVPSTAFYVGSINVDNRATTTVNNINSPGSTITATSVARTDVAPAPRVTPVVRADAPPPPPRITGSGPRREGSLNG